MSAKFETRDIVVPGDLLYEGRISTGENTYRNEGNVYATKVGLANYNKDRVSVIALEGTYSQLVGDLVIGKVTDIELGQWKVEIGANIEAILTISDAVNKPFRTGFDMTRVLDVGDTIVAKIVDLDRNRTPILSIVGRDLGRVHEGFIMMITPSKIPRLIGKKGSMINMILRETRCQVTIGQNGMILINGRNREDEELVVKVIQKIEAEAHTSGLTNRIQEYLRTIREEKN
ncbi:S1 RNA-binding domain-containing protein [Candidatus Bathyarchaeota archaeon]|nr:S1 RNA-binding domain-containing protein [Candidatus Bathyarchaeota archaeon]